ncbi:hypothetical protein DZG00_09850 [Clavibacter lycopersici]|uniref:Single-stranded DNA-binding protein n=1 Tax=Clavibacter lycopersici TaxID=2301718 RepID=A0A399T819_9MICO|nr:hypothetical protein DZG00_09850 [Clavibacter lycopersici]RIJ61657.1 hypothetical protein DZG02_05760 [Clavibacter lycopersici]
MGSRGEAVAREARSRVAVHGTVVRRPRCIRTVEGWEIASLLVAPADARRPAAAGDTGAPDHDAVLAVCSGSGASRDVPRLGVGDEVIVVGRLVPRRGARPEDDAVELVADAVLARRPTGSVVAEPPEPRIAP